MYAESTKDFAVALIVPNKDVLFSWAKSEASLDGLDLPALCERKESEKKVIELLNKVIDQSVLK